MTKVCIWGAWYESANAGDQAVLMAIARLLSQQIPDLELVVLSNRPQFTKDYMRSVYPVRALSQRYSLLAVLRELVTCELFLLGGGTPFYDDWLHLVAMLLLVGTTRLAGKPVMTYAVSARPFNSTLGRLLARASLGLVNLVTVREPQAVGRLRSLGARKPIYLFTDPAVTLEPLDDADVRKILSKEGVEVGNQPLVAICPHFLSPDHSYRIHHYEEFSKEAIEQYHQVLAQAADWLTNRGQVLFVPLNTESPDDDCQTIDLVCDSMAHSDRCHVIRRQYGPREIAGIFKQCEFVLAVRLHAAVLASSVFTPTVAISYGPKVEGYMKLVKQEANILHLETLEKEHVLSLLDSAWYNRQNIRQALTVTMDEMHRLAVSNAKMAASLIG